MSYNSQQDFLSTEIPLNPDAPEEDLRRARLMVCANAEGVAEAETFLRMLGLL